uniref:Centrosomal protein of 70 kDa n=1 Tax=Crocodylus porosus TaxID=8502 RepID=A0A7M4FSP2_CROPO
WFPHGPEKPSASEEAELCSQEKAEWENLNKLLMRHGLKPVSLATPRNSKNLTVLDKHSSLGIRLALKTLVEDTERQQKMMQGLIQANRQLREEVRLERGRASRQEQHANDLEKTVENIKSKICQLEDETIAKVCQQQNQVKELQKDQHVSQVTLIHYLGIETEETIAHLQKEIYKAGVEEQERITTQNKMFCQFCKQALFQSFQNQLIETKARNEQLQHENINFKKELETRPTVQELKLYKHQVKKLEKTLKKNIKSREFIMGEKIKENKESEIITEDQLQAVCRQYLQVLSSIDSVLSSPRAPPLIYKRSKGPIQNGIKENGQECGFEHLPPTVEMWADQIMALKDLYRSLRKLSQELVPWHTIDIQDNSEWPRVEDLQFIVDAILEEIENREKNSQIPSLQTLYAIVSHFQKLFDVSSLYGVYPRMNEVYTKLGEMTNAMRNLHDLLELDSSAPPTVLVDTVGKLCNIINENVTEQVEQLLGTQDILSIISKLEEHEYFFPAFQALIQDLLCVLGKSFSTIDEKSLNTK